MTQCRIPEDMNAELTMKHLLIFAYELHREPESLDVEGCNSCGENNINPSAGNIHQIIGHYSLWVLLGEMYSEDCLYMVHC